MARSRSPIEDPSDPYYLHHGDNPGNVLVSQLLTRQDNYIAWCRAMELAISVKNKLGFLNGSISKPPITDHILYNAWIRNNNIVISWIINSVSKKISSSILYDESAAAIWNDLRVRFQQKNRAHIYNLRKDLMNLRQENQTVSIYFTKLKTVWEQLSNFRPNCSCNGCSCGGVKKLHEYHNMEYIMSFLMGISDLYAQVRGNILVMDPLPEINRVFHLVTQEENQRKGQNNPSDPNSNMAFAFQGEKNSGKGETQGPPKNQQPKRGRPFCSHCSMHGHTIEKCYKIHGYPPGYNKGGKSKEAAANQFQTSNETSSGPCENNTLLPQLTPSQYQQLLNLLGAQTTNLSATDPSTSNGNSSIILTNYAMLSKDKSWIIDSGATRHICSDLHLFQNIHSIVATKLILPNNDSLLETYTKMMIGKGESANGLYMLDTTPVLINAFTSAETWHKRLGHLSDNAPELAFKDLFSKNRISHDFTCIETPEQNVVAERKHQHLLNVARALYFQSKVPIQYWTECLMTAETFIPTPAHGENNEVSQQEHPTPPPAAPRRTSRVTRPPSYLQDFECYNLLQDKSSSPHPISKFMSYAKLSKAYKEFILVVTAEFEPQSYKQAAQFKQWLKAMDNELLALIINNTWTIVPLP
ncbi:retrovirus-related Pol polyprotein from transposon RE2 [Cannabis sativa]|uniref:retrovirus-related Pol polyprotein from transposon RE2 n=1 Tax=Cannabis sativa TaxID=3483 RepID=UPI0029CA29D3|nr:retrovirus-related Pol polyprotein from transposon RE2 [Cannabis sativa]